MDVTPVSRRSLWFFFIAAGLVGFAGTLYETSFNNFLSSTYYLTPKSRGFLELPREAPGFLLALVTALFFLVGEKTVAAISCLTMAAGLVVLAFFGSTYSAMLAGLLVWSVGAHLIMPMRTSIAMSLATPETRGRRLGQTQAAGLGAGLVACIAVAVVMHFHPAPSLPPLAEAPAAIVAAVTDPAALIPPIVPAREDVWGIPTGYAILFIAAGGACVLAALLFLGLKTHGPTVRRPPIVFRRYMWLYYWLAFLFGARKQTFLTFGPWVLIEIFGQPVTIIATLWMVGSLLGLVTQPFLGRMIDRYGERAVLVADSLMVLVVTSGYGWAHKLGDIGLWILYACFVADQLLFGMEMARETYLSKIARCREDISPSLSVGVSANHIAAMTLPFFGGALWLAWGHEWVFMAAAGIALVMGLFSLLIKIPPAPAVEPALAGAAGPGSPAAPILPGIPAVTPNARSSVRILLQLAETAPEGLSGAGDVAGLDNTMQAEQLLEPAKNARDDGHGTGRG